ncbi:MULTISPECIES: tail protein X [unclassified Rhizobium]|uniref:tail protein X n=1 Tax=unclassified Rhizobium TaxID=2613769 RepID=UPI001ADA7EC0|nr:MULTISPECIES: tail protein X [unclassified Rhizobium]MBO9125445.1 tail protein X [Rhizobium sp. 16-488-2b]MBO9176030.1 tail protein X [Rhizobium sp. 16-488-2a]
MPQTFKMRREGMTVDLLLHQAYGVEGRSLIPETLAKNPGLSELGTFLPLGTVLTIPDKPAADAFVYKPVMSIFGN